MPSILTDRHTMESWPSLSIYRQTYTEMEDIQWNYDPTYLLTDRHTMESQPEMVQLAGSKHTSVSPGQLCKKEELNTVHWFINFHAYCYIQSTPLVLNSHYNWTIACIELIVWYVKPKVHEFSLSNKKATSRKGHICLWQFFVLQVVQPYLINSRDI